MELEKFYKTLNVKRQPECQQDMIKCPKCRKCMGVKKWARLAAVEQFTCPYCSRKFKPTRKFKIVFRQPSRFRKTADSKDEASVTIRPDGTKLIKEKLTVRIVFRKLKSLIGKFNAE
jgi:hypothetical protein